MVIAVSGEFGDDLCRFVYYRVENGKILEREEVATPQDGIYALVKQFIGLEIDLLISGKISGELESELREAGINLITGIRDRSDLVIKKYLDGTLCF